MDFSRAVSPLLRVTVTCTSLGKRAPRAASTLASTCSAITTAFVPLRLATDSVTADTACPAASPARPPPPIISTYSRGSSGPSSMEATSLK